MNLYDLFGLTADAHPDVIKAAYRALAKQYHPDGAGAGNPEATEKFIELQNAYEILGNPDRRADYDAALAQSAGDEIEAEPETSIDPDEAWRRRALQHPEIDSIHAILFGYSPHLGNRFRLAVINDECGDDPASFAADLERAYFEKYFGRLPDVQALARRFLAQGNRAAAKDLNAALKSVNLTDADSVKVFVATFERRYAEQAPEKAPQGARRKTRVPPPRKGPAPQLLLLLGLLAVTGIWAYIYSSYHMTTRENVAEKQTELTVQASGKGSPGFTTPDGSAQEPLPDDRVTISIGEEPKSSLAPANRAKQLYDRIVGDQEVSGQPQPAEASPAAQPVDLLPKVEPAVELPEKLPMPGVDQQGSAGQGLPDPEPPPPLPVPGTDNSETLLPVESGKGDMPSVTARNSAPLAGRRVALVLGNSDYQFAPPLANPERDATAMEALLTSLGFEVITGFNLGKRETEAKVSSFVDTAAGADISLLYYAGHGIQVDGRNFIVPVDARAEKMSSVDFELVNVSTIIDYMGGKSSTGIVLLDACRNNPFTTSLARALGLRSTASVNAGLAEITPSNGGLLIGFATAPGDVAEDGAADHSPFTTALLANLGERGVEIELMMKHVKAEVIRMTNNGQRPWTNSDLATEIYLGGRE